MVQKRKISYLCWEASHNSSDLWAHSSVTHLKTYRFIRVVKILQYLNKWDYKQVQVWKGWGFYTPHCTSKPHLLKPCANCLYQILSRFDKQKYEYKLTPLCKYDFHWEIFIKHLLNSIMCTSWILNFIQVKKTVENMDKFHSIPQSNCGSHSLLICIKPVFSIIFCMVLLYRIAHKGVKQ